jgi:hypothetical protein
MSSISCFYFDGAIVQIVKASFSAGVVTVQDALTFPYDELDAYLAGCREKSFIVSCNPLSFHQDIVHLPPAASRQYGKLVRSELQKLHPELTSFTSFHAIVSQVTIDSKVYNKIAAFSYFDNSLTELLATFNRYGKVVSAVYAAPISIFRLLASTCQKDADHPRMFIASIPGEKFFLVGEHNELEFIRKIPSSEAALLPADIQNINMTLDYCFQTLRVRPVEAIMLSNSELLDEQLPQLSVPLISSLPPELTGVPQYVMSDYLAPLAAVFHHATLPYSGDILPSDYVSFSKNKKVFAAGSVFMAVCALILAGYTMTQWMVISDLKSGIGTVRAQLSSSDAEIATYQKLDEEVKAFDKPLEIIRKHSSSLNPAVALAALKLPGAREYAIAGISIQEGAEFLEVRIEGTIDASGFSNVQATFEWIIEQLGKIPGYTVASSTLDIKLKTFKILARFTGSGQKGK